MTCNKISLFHVLQQAHTLVHVLPFLNILFTIKYTFLTIRKAAISFLGKNGFFRKNVSV